MNGRSRTRAYRAVPAVRPPQPIRFPDVQPLDAGPLRVLLAERSGMPILDLHLVFRHGATNDPPARPGTASMTTSTLDAGTRTRSQIDIARRLETLGTALAVHATWDHTSIGVRVLSDRLAPALDLLAELAREPAFPDTEVAHRKQLRIEAILQESDEPDIIASHAIARAIFGPDHPYGRPSAGTRASITALTRADIERFHQEHCRPGNAFLIAAGDADEETLQRAASKAFGPWDPGTPASTITAPEPAPVQPRIRLIDRPGAPQSEVRIGAVGAERRSDDYFDLLVLNTMLGGSFTSRLNLRLREERGITYGAFSRFAFRRSRGPFVAGTAVDAASTHLAIADTLDVFDTIGSDIAPEEEIDRARRYLSLGLVHGLETNAGVAARVAEVEVHSLGAGYYGGYVDRIIAVTAESVREAAARYLDPRSLAFVVVGDGRRVRKGLEGLGIGPVEEVAHAV
ncbi:MAG: pitrilysin family protein [Gemmatimonadota bacterium]